MLHPDRNFATIACCGGSAPDVLARLEYGTSCALLTADAAIRALCVANGPHEGIDARATVRVGEGGRLEVAPLRAWLGERKAVRPETLSAVVNAGAGPYLCRPLQMGADVVVEDLGDLLGPELSGWAAVAARTSEALARFLCVLGIDAAPLGDTQGVEAVLAARLPVLSLVSQARSDRAMVAANYLAAHPAVDWVSYPGLGCDPANDAARRALEHGFGWQVTFGAACGAEGFAREFPEPAPFGVSFAGPLGQGVFVLRAGLQEPLDVVAALERAIAPEPGDAEPA